MNISDDMIEEFQRDGVVVLRGVFRDWIDDLAAGVAEVMLHPSPLERSYRPQDGSAAFFQDYCNWPRIAAFRSFIFESPAAGSPPFTHLNPKDGAPLDAPDFPLVYQR